jgi:Glycosyl transferase family 2
MTFARQTSPHGTLVAVSTMKDEAPYVLEWVAHHLAVGFTDVLVYTNDCTDDTDTLLKHLESLDIGVHHRENAVPEGIKPQPSMLRRASEEVFLQEADWILILDADEFLCINHPTGTLDGIVDELTGMKAQAMVLTWRIFGSAGIRDWSPLPVTDQFTRAAPEFWNKGWGTKTLFRHDPKHLRPGVHRPMIKQQFRDTDYPDSVLWVNGSGRPLESWFKLRGWRSIRRTVGYDWAQVNHYAVKSMDAYALRKLRGNVNLKANKYNTDYWALQDRNEVEDLGIARHRARRDKIIAELLDDPTVRRLHAAACARVEARLADHKVTADYLALVESLVAASDVPINQVVANPPKPRNREAARDAEARDPKTRDARAGADKRRPEAAPDQRHPPPPGWASPFASPYLGQPKPSTGEAVPDVADNGGLKVPLDPGIFTAASHEVLKAGKFDRRHARTIAGLLAGCTALLDLDAGCGFLALRAKSAVPGLEVTIHDERPGLVQFSQRLVALNFPDPSGIHHSQLTLNPDALWSGLHKLLIIARPDALRLSDARLPAEAFPPSSLSGLRRVLIPFLDPSDVPAIRSRLAPAFATAGLTEDPAGEAAGTLLFRRF